MADELQVRGMVLSAAPSGEYDRRIVLLTKERGKITAFAHGARKPTSSMLAATNPFAFGTFYVYEGKNAYTLVKADITQYFRDLLQDSTTACYAVYFLEVADYYSRENLDAAGLLNLLYITLRALSRPNLPRELIRVVFEIRSMVIEGEYPQDLAQDPSVGEAVRCAIAYAVMSPLGRLYNFKLEPEALQELIHVQELQRRRAWPREFKSMEVLRAMQK